MGAPWSPGPAPQVKTEDGETLAAWVSEELERFQKDLLENTPALDLRPSFAAPLRPAQGMFVYADGTSWNPGSGEGPYYRNAAGLWIPLKPVPFPIEVLTADRTYFVNDTTGSDALNNGLSAGAPFKTINKAIDTAVSVLGGIFNMTISVADGTYTAETIIKSYTGSGTWSIVGNIATPANCIISLTANGACCFRMESCVGKWFVQGFTVTSTTNGVGVFCFGNTSNLNLQFMIYGVCTSHQIDIGDGAYCFCPAYTITGASGTHMTVRSGANVNSNFGTVTIVGAPVIGLWLQVVQAGVSIALKTYVGAPAAGTKKYDVTVNGAVEATTFGGPVPPGTVAGTTASGGQFV